MSVGSRPGSDPSWHRRLALRTDLVFSLRGTGRGSYVVVRDPVRSRYFRIGTREHEFIVGLDGQRTVRQALEESRKRHPGDPLEEADAVRICQWLLGNELAIDPLQPAAIRGGIKARVERAARLRRWFDLVVIRIPLCNPDRFLSRALPYFQWLFRGPTFLAGTAFCLFAVYRVAVSWDRAADAAYSILVPSTWPWILGFLVLTHAIHEFAHGLVLKYYGKEVPEFGILLVVLVPLGYTNASAAWDLRSPWQRIHVSIAGIGAECLLASLAAWIWSGTGPGLVNTVAFSLMVASGVTTLVFNLNPLTRLDGYYILSDLTEQPNLYYRGIEYVKWLWGRYGLGFDGTAYPPPADLGWFIRCYGLAALFWRALLLVSILLAAGASFGGFGLLVAILAGFAWLRPLVLWFWRSAAAAWNDHPVRFLGHSAAMSAVAAALGVTVATAAWPGYVSVPGVVQYTAPAVVRAGASGFVAEIDVQPGQVVEAGALLVTLSNPELEYQWQEQTALLEKNRLEAMIYSHEESLPAYQIARRNREALQVQLAETEAAIQALCVRAPVSGTVLARDLNAKRGSHVEKGEALVTLVTPNRKELQAVIPQDSVEQFQRHVGKPVRVRMKGSLRARMRAVLIRISPQATREILHPALTSLAGGDLLVQQRGEPGRTSSAGEGTFEMLAPGFVATCAMTEDDSVRWMAGQTCRLLFRDSERTIRQALRQGAAKWLSRRSSRVRPSSRNP